MFLFLEGSLFSSLKSWETDSLYIFPAYGQREREGKREGGGGVVEVPKIVSTFSSFPGGNCPLLIRPLPLPNFPFFLFSYLLVIR